MSKISYYGAMFMVFMLFASMMVVLFRGATEPDACKNKGYSGYVMQGTLYECSNGEINKGCIVTENGIACGDVSFTKIKK